jgi:hypothetical protein
MVRPGSVECASRYTATMPEKHPKRPRDLNQWAKHMVDLATGATQEPMPSTKNQAAAELGRRGGLKGGKARAAKLTQEQRIKSARKAAKARWSSKNR